MPFLAAVAASLVLAALPRAGVLVPGETLGGVRLGMTQAQVRATWGAAFGRCRDCAETTWYFNYHRFQPQGAGVTFRAGRVISVFTLWSPQGWRTDRGLRIGDDQARVSSLYGALLPVACGTYTALVEHSRTAQTAFYIVDGKIWGFGLSAAAAPVCR